MATTRGSLPGTWASPGACLVLSTNSSTRMTCPCSNLLLICEGRGCSVVVHQQCYGVARIPKGRWLCDACTDKLSPAAANCACCPVVGGALRKVSEDIVERGAWMVPHKCSPQEEFTWHCWVLRCGGSPAVLHTHIQW